MKTLTIAAASFLSAAAWASYAAAQPAPENLPSTYMQRDGGSSGSPALDYGPQIYTGRSVWVAPYDAGPLYEDDGGPMLVAPGLPLR